MLFDSTLRRELARSFGATLVVILTIVLTMMLIRTLGQAAGGRVAPQDVVLLLGYAALGHLPTMLALSLFVSIVSTLGRLYRDSEMAVWFASGVGLTRFLKPVLLTSWPVLLLVGTLVLIVWPWGNRNSEDLRQRYEQRSDLSRVSPGVFQTSRDGRRVFFIERDQGSEAEGRNVFVLSSDGNSESVTSARSGRLVSEGNDRLLVLEDGQRNELDLATGEKTLARFETYRLLAWEGGARPEEQRRPRSLATPTLLAEPTGPNQGELSWRLGLLLGAANLMLLGLGLAASNPRRPSNWNLLFALLAFVVYYNLINLGQAWVSSGRYGLVPVLVGLHGGAFVLALALMWWREQAVVAFRLAPQRRRGAAR
ncbi:LPS export ABC transporter permease LptF [Aquabacterium sp. J223]|uniref:LPS export ABC transporter permease LptF n=1 Tax=Aquabacterium sp. J223 TaxID=2898431 RepID=UPI0021AE2530|nr:LPS export ABC transporter permease LptF [Aquabacterium sp. J223]UUX94819.1 LPS export ABC transporter permease LptF [Aquabacterium sp. J223]